VLVAYDPIADLEVAAYEPEAPPFGPLSYHRDSNTLIFAERPGEAPLSGSRLTLLTGTVERELRGAEGLGLYDPSPPVPALGGAVAVIWTDGERTGVGFLDPATWTFRKSAVETRPGSRYPQVSHDGATVALYEGGGSTIAVRELDDGETVRTIRDAQREAWGCTRTPPGGGREARPPGLRLEGL
jgi:hypothetical protein